MKTYEKYLIDNRINEKRELDVIGKNDLDTLTNLTKRWIDDFSNLIKQERSPIAKQTLKNINKNIKQLSKFL